VDDDQVAWMVPTAAFETGRSVVESKLIRVERATNPTATNVISATTRTSLSSVRNGTLYLDSVGVYDAYVGVFLALAFHCQNMKTQISNKNEPKNVFASKFKVNVLNAFYHRPAARLMAMFYF